MDFETVLIDSKHVPYLLSWYDGVTSHSHFIKNLDKDQIKQNILDMIKEAMDEICIKKYENHSIYLHNLSKFDGYFLIKYLAKLGITSPIINNGKIISIAYTHSNFITMNFKDSLLILQSSLKKLGKSFNVESQKSIFPYLLTDISYKGAVPDFKYLTNISLDQYKEYVESYKDREWNFKDEAIKYCEIDCISLYQIVSKFNRLIFNKFSLNMKYPTTSSLAMGIWKTHFLDESPDKAIHKLSGQIANDIRLGYTGGAVDMYIPKPKKWELVYHYDVNSLYPSVMLNKPMPIGEPTFFNGNILKRENRPFGFFFCNIIAPNNLLHPILQTHVKTNDGMRTIAPLGQWQDMLFSEELYNAMKFGYKFEVLWGYTYKKAIIFKDYVENLYNLRLQYPKSDPMNYIAKILMNSLYGRFGMNDNFTSVDIIDKRDYLNFRKNNPDNIIDVIDLDEFYLVKSRNTKSYLDNELKTHDVNVAIAATVTSESRIIMSQFKNNPLFNLFYTDTDSIFTNMELKSNLVSDTILGKMKLEGIYKDAIFLAPKVYGFIDQNNQEIIKVKGLTNNSLTSLHLADLDKLLVKDSNREFNQDKWYRSIPRGSISINL